MSSTTTTEAKVSMLREALIHRSELFRKLDADGNGHIDVGELQTALTEAGAKVSYDEAAKILKDSDTNGNGLIEIDELLGVITKGTVFESLDLGR